jgi:PAS domain S-box-containing protein
MEVPGLGSNPVGRAPEAVNEDLTNSHAHSAVRESPLLNQSERKVVMAVPRDDQPEPAGAVHLSEAGALAPASGAADDRQAVNAINQRIFDTSLDLILVVSRRGAFIRVSPSARTILGYDPAEMIGRSAEAFLYPPDLENTRNEMRLARHGRLMRNFECRYVHRDGHLVPLWWMGVWSEPEQQYFFIGRDISDREIVEQRLRQAQRMDAVGQLTGGMAHDFNNLLGIIIANLDLLRDSATLDAEQREILGDAVEAALRGADLTRRLLAFARRQPLQPERVEINELVSNTAALLARTLGERIPIRVKLAADLWPVMVDPAQLEASLINLATNARDAMPRGGELTIATANRALDAEYTAAHAELLPGDYVMIEVSDTGSGIPPEVVARVFEPFFTTKEAGKGTGLGLSMVFGFVKQSGGHVNVYSEVGEGTTFRLYLRRADAAAAPAAQPMQASPADGGSETILVVEDNEGIRRAVRRQLMQLGYRVIEAENAAEAQVALAAEPVVLLFTDIVMPGEMDGVELARTAMAKWPGLKVVLTSGFPESRLSGNGEAPAGLRLLSKPYRRDELARVLREALDEGQSGGGQ